MIYSIGSEDYEYHPVAVSAKIVYGLGIGYSLVMLVPWFRLRLRLHSVPLVHTSTYLKLVQKEGSCGGGPMSRGYVIKSAANWDRPDPTPPKQSITSKFYGFKGLGACRDPSRSSLHGSIRAGGGRLSGLCRRFHVCGYEYAVSVLWDRTLWLLPCHVCASPVRNDHRAGRLLSAIYVVGTAM